MEQKANIVFEGGCLCGKIRYSCTAQPISTVHCHCTDCRRIGGTAHATHTVIPKAAFTIAGVPREYARLADSGNEIVRRFCPDCASAIFHTREGLENMIVVRTSSMDDPELVTPERAIFTDSAVSWDPVNTSLPSSSRMTQR